MSSTGCDDWEDFYTDDDPPETVQAMLHKERNLATGIPPSAVDVAEIILQRLTGNVDGWRLQKLCYLTQAHHLVTTGVPAFREPVEAWTHGPVVYRLYQQHRGETGIKSVNGDPSVAANDPILDRVIDEVVAKYGHWSGPQLRELTHNQAPWLQARADLAPDQPSRRHISVPVMHEYFERLEALPDDDIEDDCMVAC